MARQIITPTSITMAGLMSVLSLWAKKFRVPFVKYCLTQLNIEMCPNTTSANNRFKALILFFQLKCYWMLSRTTLWFTKCVPLSRIALGVEPRNGCSQPYFIAIHHFWANLKVYILWIGQFNERNWPCKQ